MMLPRKKVYRSIADNKNYTNANIEHFRLNFREVIEQSDKYTHSEATDLLELKALIGTVYLRVSTKVNLRSGLWNMVPRKFKIFAALLSWKHFSFLVRLLSFDDKCIWYISMYQTHFWRNQLAECIDEIPIAIFGYRWNSVLIQRPYRNKTVESE